MFIKVIIILLFIGNLLALSRSFYTLVSGQGTGNKKTVNMLTIRVVLAVLLISAIGIGLLTGDLHLSAPWHHPR
ncbi:MAG: DUF2909 family protein [Gammaproteobacteria bacterium]|nr:DUF2909 family protein [Gammaproteobacteria bacterium]